MPEVTKQALRLLTAFAAGFGCALVAVTYWPEPEPSAPQVFYRASVTPRSTDDLALKMTPHVQQFIVEHKQDFINRAGGPMERMAVRFGIPVAQREVPVVLEHGIDALALELKDWSVDDLLKWFASVADNKGVADGRLVRELKAARP